MTLYTRIEFITARIVIVLLCCFCWYILYAILGNYQEFDLNVGYLLLANVITNLTSIGLTWVSDGLRAKICIFFNVFSFVPFLYFIYITVPQTPL